IVRGDVPGSYGLTAGYHGRLQPFDADVDIAATLADPLRVWGADALRLRVQADSGPLVAGRPYHVRVGLTNDADVPFYNVALGLDPDGAGSDSSGAARFIYQPGERFDDVVGEIDPGETVYSHTYVLVPDGASTGALDPATSSALFAGQAVSGDPVVEAMTPPPLYQLTAPTDTEGEVHLHWQQVPGAEGYEVFSIPDLDTPFDAAPEEVQGGDDSYGTVLGPGVSDAYLPAAAGARYYAVSTIVDGRPTLEHAVIVGQPGTSAPGGGTSGAGGGEAPAGGGPVDDGRGAPAPGCPDHARTLLNGAVTIEATCFTEASPGVLSATGRIRVNGLDLETSGAFRIDLGKLTLSADGAIDAYAGSLHLYHGELRLWSLKAHLTLPALPKLRIKGLPVTGNVDVGLVPHGAEAKLGASIGNPSTPFAVTGQVTLRLTLASGLQLDSLDLALDSDIPIATLVVKRASLSYRSTRAGDVWTGKVSAQLPSGPDVSGSLSVTGGAVSEVGITVSKLNKPIGAIVFLQSLGLDVTLKPRLSATGSVGLTAGPKILNGSAAAIDGSLSLRLTSPVMLTASGDLKVVDLHVASASLQAAIPGSVAFSGDVHKDFPGFGVDANLGGTVSTKSFEAKGGFALNVPGASGTGDALVNEHGVAACATAETALLHQRFTIGAAYRWGQGPRLLDGSCGFGELRDTIAHAAQRGVPVTTIPVPRAHRQLNVVAHGAGRPPALRLSLGSARATVRPGSAGRLGTTAYVAVADEAHDDTVVIIASPPAGRVVVTAAPGSSPILGVRTSIELPDPRVRVRVAAPHDGRYRLSWTSRRISGQRLTLWLRAGRASRLLLHDASRSSGHVDFTALPGSTVQHVRVVVSQDGLPRKIIESAATLHARRVVLHAPKVTLRRHGSKATIAWTAVHGAARYVVTVRTSDGRRLFYSRSARSRSLTVHSTGRLTASVRGEDAGLRDGPARSVTSGG
ncbi:MAG TPA: hypothetical protein VHB30_06705, partial [Solirubrobacteraceae bacterium]|nr:hypothetical protein [Solirubrobacteraceae bacterium]